MRKPRNLWLMLIIIVLAVLFGRQPPAQKNSNQKTPVSPTSARPATATQSATIARVIDGDTVELETGQKLRYIGIDTPETVDPRKPVQCFGKEAAEKNRQLVEGKTVTLVRDVSDKDKYGRLLRYVYLDGVMVNEILVQEGYAYAATFPPDVQFTELFTRRQHEARESGRGLWSGCPLKGK